MDMKEVQYGREGGRGTKVKGKGERRKRCTSKKTGRRGGRSGTRNRNR